MSTLYIQQHRDNFSQQAVSLSRIAHFLRIQLDSKSQIQKNLWKQKWEGDGSLNKYTLSDFFQSEDELNEKSLRKILNELDNKISEKFSKPDFDVRAAKDERSQIKKTIKSWLGNEKNEKAHKIFTKIFESLESNEIIDPDLTEQFSELLKTDLIARHKQKSKAIKSITKNHNNIVLACVTERFAEKPNKKAIRVVEHVFKIPLDNQISIKSEDLDKIIQLFHNEFYKDFKMLASAVHVDEQDRPGRVRKDGSIVSEDEAKNPSGNHFHIALSGFNNVTGKYDYPDAEFTQFKQRAIEKNVIGDWTKKDRWEQLDQSDLIEYGEFYQSELFEFYNKNLKLLNYDVNFQKLEQTEETKTKNRRIKLAKKNKKTDIYSQAGLAEEALLASKKEALTQLIEANHLRKIIIDQNEHIKSVAVELDQIVNQLEKGNKAKDLISKEVDDFKEKKGVFYKLAVFIESKNPLGFLKIKKVFKSVIEFFNIDFAELNTKLASTKDKSLKNLSKSITNAVDYSDNFKNTEQIDNAIAQELETRKELKKQAKIKFK